MKNYFTAIVFMVLAVINVRAQNPKSGIYKTFSDYNNNIMSYEIDCKTEKHTIRLNEFINESHITIKHNGEKIKLQKDSIYGILSCDEPLIRFQNKSHFYLVEKGPVWIFYKEAQAVQAKGFKYEKTFYFSTKGDGKLMELTLKNIKEAFPDNHPLHDALSAQFQNTDISEYDTFHKMFKINHIINSVNTGYVCPTHQEVKGKEGDKCSKCGMSLEPIKNDK